MDATSVLCGARAPGAAVIAGSSGSSTISAARPDPFSAGAARARGSADAASRGPRERHRVRWGSPDRGVARLPVYPTAQFITSYDAGRGQRYYLFGADAKFPTLLQYYQSVLKTKGTLVFDAPATQVFEVGKFDDRTMAFPPGVTIKDYTWNGSAGYLNQRKAGSPDRFATIIQIVPAPAGTPDKARPPSSPSPCAGPVADFSSPVLSLHRARNARRGPRLGPKDTYVRDGPAAGREKIRATRLEGCEPCAAVSDDAADAIRKMASWATPVPSFGGLVMVNFPIDEKPAEELLKFGVDSGRRILDAISAPSFTPGAVQLLAQG